MLFPHVSYRTLLTTISLAVGIFASAQKPFVQKGYASYYHDKFQGRRTASGDKYDTALFTAAHLRLPFGAYVKVTNTKNQKSVIVKINDRGPFVKGRSIDVSKAAAQTLGLIGQGIVPVTITKIDAETAKKMMAATPAPTTQTTATTTQPVKTTPPPQTTSTPAPTPVPTSKQNTPAPPQPAPQKSSATGFGIQVGSFKELKNAQNLAASIKSKYGQESYMLPKSVNGQVIYKLVVGKVSTQTEADALKSRLKAEFPQCFVVDHAKQ